MYPPSRHLDHYWGAPRLLFTSVWLKVYDLWDGNEQAMAVWGETMEYRTLLFSATCSMTSV